MKYLQGIQKGSVLRFPNGDLRVVRKATFWPDGNLHSVTLAIRRCSWTGRCYTVIDRVTLKHPGATLAHVKPRPLKKIMDRKIERAIGSLYKTVTCCDVHGVP